MPNTIEYIRRYAINLNLLIVVEKSKCDNFLLKANMNKGSRSKRKQKRFIVAKTQYEQHNIFLEELIREKQELETAVALVLDKYNKEYKKVFISLYFENKSVDLIASELSLEKQAVEHIISCLNEDLGCSVIINEQ